MLTWRSGGALLAASLAFALTGTLYNLWPVLTGQSRPRGDGRRADSYGFDLASCRIAAGRIVASGMPVDGLPALTGPALLDAASLETADRGRDKYLVGSDRVVGVALGGEARAYPLRLLAWHEVVNDTLGGRPIAVTYHPLSEGVAVFKRGVGGETLEFGVSGLLYQSNLLMYDRRPEGRGESLWSQLLAQAVCGPAARSGARLETLPFSLASWEDWVRLHPQTTVLAPIESEWEQYRKDVYGTYFNTEALKFPVDPMPPPRPLRPKTRLLAIGDGGRRGLVPLDFPPEPLPRSGILELAPGIRIHYGTRPATVLAEPDRAEGTPMVHAFWFAWYATRSGEQPDRRPAQRPR